MYKMNKNNLLCFMILCYLIPIYYVYYYYNSNNSVSNIICNESYKYHIIFFMLLMGVGTILYELERGDNFSTCVICLLLIGIYGLICIDENNVLHYVFALAAFLSILGFMMRHCYFSSCNNVLLSSLLLEILLLTFIGLKLNENIFYAEVIYILNFAFFYLYLHYFQNI